MDTELKSQGTPSPLGLHTCAMNGNEPEHYLSRIAIPNVSHYIPHHNTEHHRIFDRSPPHPVSFRPKFLCAILNILHCFPHRNIKALNFAPHLWLFHIAPSQLRTEISFRIKIGIFPTHPSYPRSLGQYALSQGYFCTLRNDFRHHCFGNSHDECSLLARQPWGNVRFG